MAAGKMRTSPPKNGLDPNWGRALRQQRARDPEIHDAPIRLRKPLRVDPRKNGAKQQGASQA
jgi:hypothetical protein